MLNAEQSQEIVGSMGKDGTEEHHPGVHTEVLCLPVPTALPLRQGRPKGYTGTCKWCLQQAETPNQSKNLGTCPICLFGLLSLNTSQTFHFNTERLIGCKLLIDDYDKILMVNLTCAGT